MTLARRPLVEGWHEDVNSVLYNHTLGIRLAQHFRNGSSAYLIVGTATEPFV